MEERDLVFPWPGLSLLFSTAMRWNAGEKEEARNRGKEHQGEEALLVISLVNHEPYLLVSHSFTLLSTI